MSSAVENPWSLTEDKYGFVCSPVSPLVTSKQRDGMKCCNLRLWVVRLGAKGRRNYYLYTGKDQSRFYHKAEATWRRRPVAALPTSRTHQGTHHIRAPMPSMRNGCDSPVFLDLLSCPHGLRTQSSRVSAHTTDCKGTCKGIHQTSPRPRSFHYSISWPQVEHMVPLLAGNFWTPQAG